MILLISYDLKGHERPSAYERVREMIEEKSLASKRILYSQWIVETGATVGDWHESLKLAADSTDNWFILEVTRPYKGWLPRSVWDWLNERL